MGWGRGCDGDGVLRLTWVIIVCCRPCASLLWHPVSVQYTSFRDSPCPYKIFIYIYSIVVYVRLVIFVNSIRQGCSCNTKFKDNRRTVMNIKDIWSLAKRLSIFAKLLLKMSQVGFKEVNFPRMFQISIFEKSVYPLNTVKES